MWDIDVWNSNHLGRTVRHLPNFSVRPGVILLNCCMQSQSLITVFQSSHHWWKWGYLSWGTPAIWIFQHYAMITSILCEMYVTTSFWHINCAIIAWYVRWDMVSQIARFMGPTWGPPGSCRPQMGPMLAPWALLSGLVCNEHDSIYDMTLMSSLLPWWIIHWHKQTMIWYRFHLSK